jgi:hypothetical protein
MAWKKEKMSPMRHSLDFALKRTRAGEEYGNNMGLEDCW